MVDARSAIGPDTLQGRDTGPGCLHLDQGRAELGAFVSETAQELVAGHGAAQLGASQAAAGDDELVEFQGLLPGGDGEGSVLLLDFQYPDLPPK